MNSWIIWVVWGSFTFAAVLLGFVGRRFALRTLRYVTAVTAAVVVVLVTRYGLTHPANPPKAFSDLATSFTHGADELSAAFFHPLLLVLPRGQVPAPGRIGWVVIAVLLVIGYRMLEAWAMRREAPVLDTSTLGDSQPDGASDRAEDTVTDGQRHDDLVARLKFQLSAIDVRAPAILPGGRRSDGLASIAEASGVAGSNLASAIIQFFGMFWPSPRRFQVRVRVEPGSTKVTVSLDEPATGQSVATKTIAAGDTDEAAAQVAGYVAQHIFRRDPTTPPWCVGAANGRDLAAMLLARQKRVDAKSTEDICSARSDQIDILKEATGNNQCAGIVRYELAQLHDLAGEHLEALRLHALNREQYPRFYRGRYRLSMSLEMIANPTFQLRDKDHADMLVESLAILNRCGVTKHVGRPEDDIKALELQCGLRETLLEAAAKELRAIRRELTLRHVIWGTFRHRDERVIRVPHWGLRKRQSFHDGLRVAELLVALRRSLNEAEPAGTTAKLHHMRPALRIAAHITGGKVPIGQPWARQKDWKLPPAEKRDRTRWLPWQHRTPSWEAAYNTACVYAALDLDQQVVISLQRAINDRDCEMHRPFDWISQDPDFYCLKLCSKEFNDFLGVPNGNNYPAAVHDPVNAGGMEPGAASGSPEAVLVGERR